MAKRVYQRIAENLKATGNRDARMRSVADTLWHALEQTGVSWVGFYLPDGPDEMVLGPARNKPACSPIGMHGACGQTFLSREPMVVRDVRDLGANYVACDPRDLAECVVPCLDENGQCWAVLDLDSFDVGAFDDSDVAGLQMVLRAADLTT